jgi:nucleotide-binding universal stress UspA family protein
MTGFERITVLIEQARTGRNLLLYVRELSRLAHTREVELLHVVPYQPSAHMSAIPLDGSGYWVSGEAIRRRDEQIAAKKLELEELSSELLSSTPERQVMTNVLFGSTLYETLDHTMNRETDLLVVGRHFVGDGQADEQATMARRLAMKTSCSVLVLPEQPVSLPTRILVPVRDSECSAQALETACMLASSTAGLVFALNVYTPSEVSTPWMPEGWEPSDLPAARAGEENARLRERIDSHGVYVEYLTQADSENRPEDRMLEAVEKTCAHAVVIGARGRTGAAGVLLGKVTEKLIAKGSVPVFAIKKKGEMLGVLQAVLALTRK